MIKIITFIITLLFLVTTLGADELCSLATDALARAENIRELKVKTPVKCKVQNKQEVEKYLRDTINFKIPDQKIRNEEHLFKKIGLLPIDYQYKEEIIKLYTGQLAGYYEPVSEYYVMAGWMPAMMQMPIAVHELTHALQDQYFNLDNFLDSQDLTSDQALARSAVVEGDATCVMYDYLSRETRKPILAKQPDVQSFVFQAVASSNMMAGFKEAPRAMQAFLLFPYTSGFNFSHYFLKKDGYSGLNKIFNRVPQTTKEILHPKYYEQGEVFTPLALDQLTSFFDLEDLQVRYQDRIGEFILSTLINLEDQNLASAWNNDLAVIEESSGKVYWLLKLESNLKAERLAEIFKKINPQGVEKSFVREEFLGLILN